MSTTIADSESKVLLLPKSKQISLSDRFTSLLNHLQPSSEFFVPISALLIGSGSGLMMVVFHYLIDLWETLSFKTLMGSISIWGAWTVALIPMLGGLIVGLMRWRYRDILGQEFAALLSDPRVQTITPLRPIIKMLAAAVSLGTGASLGPESPSVEIGAHVGILLGQLFQVSKDRYRLLLGAGVAAGLAAGFNAPIAGVFFALEVVLGTTFSAPAVGLIVLSAVFSAIISRTFLGVHPAFELPEYVVLSHWEWLFYLGLGILASVVSLLYTQGIKLAQGCFQGKIQGFTWLGQTPVILKPAIGGAIVGMVAVYLPQVLGVGYGTLETILQGQQFSLELLCLLLVIKPILTAISLGSGLVGGVFAPAIFLGACLGSIYGNIVAAIVPSSWLEIAPPAAYAIVGMAAVLAGSVKAPLTAILLLFELTHNYLIIPPLMVAVGACIWVVEQIQSKSDVEGLNFQQMGIDLEKQDELGILQQITVATVMSFSYLALKDSFSLLEAAQVMIRNKSHTALVFNEAKQLVGIITLADIRKEIVQAESQSQPEEIAKRKVKDICTTEILYAYSDESLTEVLKRMGARDLYLLPVVSRSNPQTVLGTIDKNQIFLAGDLIETQISLSPYLGEKKLLGNC
jgi:H+/Cl- antiporter ClcA/CBS domain-containing protein